MKKVVLWGALIIAVHAFVIAMDGLIDDEDPQARVAVILGSKVNADGSLSERLTARLDRGLQLYTDSLVSELYVSGGFGKEGFYEGNKMAEYLISRGVPPRHIKVDNEGVNTRNSALNFAKDYPAESSVVVVTQYFHVMRSKLAFKQVGIENVQGVHCPYFEMRDVYGLARECAGLYKYLINYGYNMHENEYLWSLAITDI